MTDAELVRQSLAGVRTATDELVDRWAARVLAFCHTRVADAHVAEDLAQEALLRGLRSLGSLESPEKFGSWLCGIAVRVCLDWRKAKQSTQVPFTVLQHQGLERDGLRHDGGCAAPFDVAVADDERAGAAQVDRSDELGRLMHEVRKLPEKHREALLLYYYQAATYQDLADLLEVSTATVNARLTEARAMLRRRLSGTRG
jgi:RNA polymerase sigma-70 factor, ECF subfamily